MDFEVSFAGRMFLPGLASKAGEDIAGGLYSSQKKPQFSASHSCFDRASVSFSRADGEVACTMTSESTLLLF